ncbi:phage head-tail connector protein [Pseudoruegeria sp. HB172150]|uniref:head-tail connector protein n=1 Tax=Pseudoruegeria sp. HB172150 TaxID=2721164 RepID=UPI001556DD98|nr:phage head-tail connector protein [Pseudoruegeria sp. HB172150]
MKMLVHRTAGSAELPFVLDDLKLHLRAPDDSEDSAIENIGATAAAEIEQFAQIALLTQTIRVTIFDPCGEQGLRLPIGPVDDDNTPTVTIDGEAFSEFEFAGGNRAYIWWKEAYFSLTPSRMTIEYMAGFGDAASDVPPDLAQALMDQAALHYDGRSPMDSKSLTASPHMARIGARYRGVQV